MTGRRPPDGPRPAHGLDATDRGAEPTLSARGTAHKVLVVFLPFALGYYLSYFFRSVNAVIAPRLAEDLFLSADMLGLLTASYFLTFAAFQLPLGVLLDRFGPRRVQAVLLTVAAIGSLVFANGDSAVALIVGRGLIGFGVSGALMSAFKALVQWFPSERLPLINAIFLVSGGLGGLSATAPLEWLLGFWDWRTLFLYLALASLAVAAVILVVVPESAPGRGRGALARMAKDLRLVFGDRAFWQLAPVCGLHIGSVWSFQGLWVAPWLRDVEGLGRAAVIDHLLAMALSFIVGTVAIGVAANRLRHLPSAQPWLFGGGFILFVAIELAILLDAPLPSLLLWPAFAFTGNLTVLAFAMLARRYPPGFIGRAMTAVNIVSLSCGFLLQYAFGAVLLLWTPLETGAYPAVAYRGALLCFIAAQSLAVAFFFRRGVIWWRQDLAVGWSKGGRERH